MAAHEGDFGVMAYDPGYKTPFYPWLPLFGAMAPFVSLAPRPQSMALR